MYVYFLKAAAPLVGPKGAGRAGSLIKIGSAADPMKRMAKLQTGSPVQLRMIGSVRCRDAAHARCVGRPHGCSEAATSCRVGSRRTCPCPDCARVRSAIRAASVPRLTADCIPR